jgi:ABC-2 type transport system permease protein
MLRLVLKDIKLFFADKKAVMLTFIVPIALITLFAFAFGAVGQPKGEARPTSLVVTDEDQTPGSKAIIKKLDSLPEIEVQQVSREKAEASVKKGDEAAILVFHKGFGDSLDHGKQPSVEFRYDAAREAEVGILRGALTGQLMRLIGTQSMSGKVISKFDNDNPDMDSGMKAAIHEQIMSNFVPSDKGGGEEQSIIKATPVIAEEQNSPGLIHAVAGTAIMMLLFSVAGMGASLLEEKQEGTLKRLLYSPLPPNSILFGKMLYIVLIAVFQLCVLFLFAWVAFGLDIFPHLLQVGLMILATAFACSSFGVLLASVARTRQQVQSLSTLIVLIMSCIGGSMIPSFIMPLFMQKMAVFSVNYWSIQGFYDIFWRNLSVNDPVFLSRLLVLVVIGVVLDLIAIQMYKRNVLKFA